MDGDSLFVLPEHGKSTEEPVQEICDLNSQELQVIHNSNWSKSKDLQDSEFRYRSLFNTMTEGFALHEIIIDAEGKACNYRFLEINPAFERLTGLTCEATVGKTVREVIPGVEDYWIETYGRVALDGIPVHIENYSAPLGRWFDVYAYRPAPGQFAVVFTDITERKKAEQTLKESQDRYRTLFHDNHATMLLIDPVDGKIIDANPAACRYYGYPLDVITNLKITNINTLPSDQVHSHMESTRLKKVNHLFFQHRLADGSIRDVEVFSGPIYLEGRKLLYSIVYDITERKKAEKQLRELNQTLEEQVAERTALAANRAIQLQNLSNELIEAEEQERQRIADLLHDDLQQILASAKMQLQTASGESTVLNHVAELLEEAISKTRKLSHQLSPSVKYHSELSDLLNWQIMQIKEQFGLEVDLQVRTQLRLGEESIKTFIYRSLTELLFNVSKHAGVKSAMIVADRSDNLLNITVSDNGRGFDVSLLDEMTDGKGIGLLRIKERATYLGGGLFIDSTPGKGSHFILQIPISDGDIKRRNSIQQQPSPLIATDIVSKSETVSAM